MTKEKYNEYKSFFVDLWDFFKKHHVQKSGNSEIEDNAWNIVLQTEKQLEQKYSILTDSRFVRNMLITCLQELEFLYKIIN